MRQVTHRFRLPAERLRTLLGTADSQQVCAGAALAVLTLVVLILLVGHWRYDDPYITFRYARNLLSGRGFVYNTGQRVLSTTAPLYAFLLAGLAAIWPDIPALSSALSALFLVVSAVLLYLLPVARGGRAVGLIAALLLSLSPDLIPTFGAETCAVVMLTLGGLVAYDRRRYSLSATLLAALVMVRPDGLLAAISVGITHLVARRSVPWRALVLWAALVGIWYAALWWYFGTPLPVTLVAKQQQGQMAISDSFAGGFLATVRTRLGLPLFWLHGVLALVGLWRVTTRSSHWVPLLLWTALYFIAYSALGVSRYFWYYGPLAPAGAVLVAEGTVAVLSATSHLRLPRSVLGGAYGLVAIALLVPLLAQLVAVGSFDDPRVETYAEAGRWLSEHTEPQASVGVLEAGIVGYYAERTMIDFAGLIQPEVARQLGPSSTYEDSAAWAIQRYWPDYVLLHATGFAQVTRSDWFRACYQPIRAFTHNGGLYLDLYVRSGT